MSSSLKRSSPSSSPKSPLPSNTISTTAPQPDTSSVPSTKKTRSSPSAAEDAFLKPVPKAHFTNPPRILVIGAGSRGSAYARSSLHATNCSVVAVAEPNAYKRAKFGRRYVWGSRKPGVGQEFEGWREWVEYETSRRERARKAREGGEVLEGEERGVDAVFLCVLDELHEEVVCGIAGLGVHVCCEKPMSVRLQSCVNMVNALKGWEGEGMDVDGSNQPNGHENGKLGGQITRKDPVFGVCHVLRYSAHNMMLRHLILEQEVIGEVLSIEHVEPVGWWHFSHSYVRGNWRKESTTAPSLLTKSCHDIDFLMWMLCSPSPSKGDQPHLPSYVTSTGSRKFFRKEMKPKEAGDATNCLSCPHEKECDYSAKKIYIDKHLKRGNTGWPVKVVHPEIEEYYKTGGFEAASEKLKEHLKEDWNEDTPVKEVEARPWFGRCVWDADNDVVDDQCVTITWDDDPLVKDGKSELRGRGAKTAQFHMVAFTEWICRRRGRIYGTKGEIEYDSGTIKVHNFSTKKTKEYVPHFAGGGHGGGDEGLARQFLMAADAVDNGGMSAREAEREFLGCDLDEAFRSHAMVFAAEDARTKRKVVDWQQWWSEVVEKQLHGR